MIACSNGHMNVIEALVDFDRARINAATNFYSKTALMIAVEKQRIDVVRLLLSLNADTTKTNLTGETAFKLAMSDEMKQLFLHHEKKTVLFECCLL